MSQTRVERARLTLLPEATGPARRPGRIRDAASATFHRPMARPCGPSLTLPERPMGPGRIRDTISTAPHGRETHPGRLGRFGQHDRRRVGDGGLARAAGAGED